MYLLLVVIVLFQLNATPAPGVVDLSYIKMKQFWGEYNKQREEEVKEKLQQLRDQRQQPAIGKQKKTIEEADQIIKDKLASAALDNNNDSSGEDRRPKTTEYEFTFNSNDKQDNPMDEGTQRLRTLEDFDSMSSKKKSVINPTELNFVEEKAQAKRKDLVELDDTKTQAVSVEHLVYFYIRLPCLLFL